MDILSGFAHGFAVLLAPLNLLLCVLAAALGLLLAFLPGVGPSVVLALALPFGFALPAPSSVILLAALAFGLTYGRGAAAWQRIGCRGAVQAAAADPPQPLVIMIGGAILAVLIVALAPLVSRAAAVFAPAEMVALIVAVLILAAAASPDSLPRASAAIFSGLCLSLLGQEIDTGVRRLSFDTVGLPDGIPMVALVLGVLLIPEVAARWHAGSAAAAAVIAGKAPPPAPDGAGEVAAAARITGAAAAGLSASLLPMLALGIPFTYTAAVLGGTLTIHGAVPGPQLATRAPDAFWGLLAAVAVANLVAIVMMLAAGRLLSLLARIDDRLTAPAVLMLACLGTYSVNNDPFEVIVMLALGLFAALLLESGWERGLLIMGFLVGGPLDVGIDRALTAAHGDAWTFLSRPVAALLLAAGIILAVIVRLTQVSRWFTAPGASTSGRPRLDG
jgi:putative tricarboxylic transport membrane protein